MSIDGDSTIHDEFISAATRGNSGISDDLIKAHFGHVAIHSRQSTPPAKGAGGLGEKCRALLSQLANRGSHRDHRDLADVEPAEEDRSGR